MVTIREEENGKRTVGGPAFRIEATGRRGAKIILNTFILFGRSVWHMMVY